MKQQSITTMSSRNLEVLILIILLPGRSTLIGLVPFIGMVMGPWFSRGTSVRRPARIRDRFLEPVHLFPDVLHHTSQGQGQISTPTTVARQALDK